MFNAHHDEYGFHPIVVFDGEGRFITAVLRPAKRPSGKENRSFLRRLMRAIRVDWFNCHRLFGPIGHIPPAEAEANYYAASDNLDMDA